MLLRMLSMMLALLGISLLIAAMEPVADGDCTPAGAWQCGEGCRHGGIPTVSKWLECSVPFCDCPDIQAGLCSDGEICDGERHWQPVVNGNCDTHYWPNTQDPAPNWKRYECRENDALKSVNRKEFEATCESFGDPPVGCECIIYQPSPYTWGVAATDYCDCDAHSLTHDCE